MNTLWYTEIESPVGPLTVQSDGEFLTGLHMRDHRHWNGPIGHSRRTDALFDDLREQLDEYFAGTRQTFDIPLRLDGTPFQQRVWGELTRIPFGTTISYGQLAERVGQPTASRAVGSANGRNPVSIIVPCHRVIASDGKLTGYGGGIKNKEWLLAWEYENSPGTAIPGLLFQR